MIVNALVGAVLGFLGNKIPFVANNQTAITNAIAGFVGGVGGGIAGNAAMGGTGNPAIDATSIGSGAIGSLVAMFGTKFLPNKGA